MARQKSSRTDTTELEAAVLGVVWQDGPCTPYAIRQHFLESPAPRWSGSAGAIYPLVRRPPHAAVANRQVAPEQPEHAIRIGAPRRATGIGAGETRCMQWLSPSL